MKKQTGIWLDLRNAWIINLPTEHDGTVEMQHIRSEIEEHVHISSTHGQSPWGPHSGDNQHSVEERMHHEEKHYFQNLLKHLHPKTEELVIFGPSEAKYGFRNLLNEQHDKPELIHLESADHMSEHQIVAWVQEYYDRPPARKTPSYGQEHH